MYIAIEELKRATELTRQGRLMEATSTIKRALGIGREGPPSAEPTSQVHVLERGDAANDVTDVTDVEFREVPVEVEPPPSPAPTEPATFEAHRFASGGRTYTYRVYQPPRSQAAPLPVIVMLHGCTQDSADFAAGTAMNDIAAQQGCIVVYPEQLARSNSMRCWNWFDPLNQQRGGGEPAMIAALAEHVVQRCNGDASRVYVAGLSAGGAMAALVAQLYPEVFAAAGVHSGLPAGAANTVRSAYAAMGQATRRAPPPAARRAAVPTIVFHGTADPTVHPDNGRHVIEDAAARMAAAGMALRRDEQRFTSGGQAVTRTVYSDAAAAPRIEHWEVEGVAHAWSGGSAAGTHADPSGPNASAAMVEFFLRQQLLDA